MLYDRKGNGILKHLDFVLMDILVLQASFYVGSRWYSHFYSKSFAFDTAYRTRAMVLLFCTLVSLVVGHPYKNILKRDKAQEMLATLRHTGEMVLLDVLALYFAHLGTNASRLTTVATWICYFVLAFLCRLIWKKMIRRWIRRGGSMRAAVLFTSSGKVGEMLSALTKNPLEQLGFVGVFLTDYLPSDAGGGAAREGEGKGSVASSGNAANAAASGGRQGVFPGNGKKAALEVPILGGEMELFSYAAHHWVDEAYLYLPEDQEACERVEDILDVMGISSQRVLFSVSNREGGEFSTVRKVGNCYVAVRSSRNIAMSQLFLKRAMDIAGGLVGCFFTLLLLLIVGPMIYLQSPGPVFFSQKRVGRNGRVFRMYKFRSMYLDAEKRKAELMARNNITDDLMFKMDDDPRIIGSEKKDRNGKPKGIGNFIRNTSIDEFPQFFNVLRGDMSLVGTRPPTLDEWEKYSEHHRKRLSMRPGITGLWQVSGRSEITDFEDVVRLDAEYIDNWTVFMDISILFRTIGVVLGGKGAK